MKKLKFLAFLMMGIIACFGMTSCGDDDDEDKDEPGVSSSIIGTWEFSYYDSEDGEVTETFTFKSNGKFVNSYKCDRPEYNYTVTGDYKVMGDVTNGCLVTMKAYDADGEYVEITAHAQIIGNILEFTNDEGEKSRWHKK